MRYLKRKHGSQRASQPQQVTVLQTMPHNDGATVYPILWFRVGDMWHGLEFENVGEAKALLSEAHRIFRSI